jgi:hypothetical protein
LANEFGSFVKQRTFLEVTLKKELACSVATSVVLRMAKLSLFCRQLWGFLSPMRRRFALADQCRTRIIGWI